MRLTFQTNFPETALRAEGLARKVPWVTARTLTLTAKDVQRELKAEMSRAFDRPTPYTLNSTFMKAATKTRLEARVWLKDNPFGKGTPADRYLAPQVYGGQRRHKGMERALIAAGVMRPGQYAVPAAGAQLDAYGNVKRSQIVQILSQLKVQQRAGYESRASGSTASRRAVRRQGVTYFAISTATRGLQPGIYLKRRFAMGSAIRPVFVFVGAPQYSKRLRFFEVGEAVAREQQPRHFASEWAKASAEARLG